jgi:hypothetical protein
VGWGCLSINRIRKQEDIFDDPTVMKYREGLTGMARINWLKARRGYSVIYA